MNIVFLCKHKWNNSLWKSSLKNHSYFMTRLYEITTYTYSYYNVRTWTIAIRSRVPRSPTAIEEAAMTAGPVRNRTAMENDATDFPHAINRGCSAINNPITNHITKLVPILKFKPNDHSISVFSLPRLNMAIPRPASDKIAIDFATIAGISTCHLTKIASWSNSNLIIKNCNL